MLPDHDDPLHIVKSVSYMHITIAECSGIDGSFTEVQRLQYLGLGTRVLVFAILALYGLTMNDCTMCIDVCLGQWELMGLWNMTAPKLLL